MQKNKAVSFGEWKDRTQLKNTVNECSLFGLFAGTALFFGCGYRALCEIGVRETLFFAGAVIGLILIVIGGFFPLVLRFPLKLLKKGTHFLGTQLLRLLMLPVFLILWCMSVFTKKKAGKKYPFTRWSGDDNAPETSYSPYAEQKYKTSGAAVFSVVNNLLLFLSRNRFFFLIPILILLVLLGLAFFFASSQAVFTFIYTLF